MILTTKEFIKEVEKLGFEVGQGINIILIYYGNDELAYIYRNKKFHVGTYSEFSECLSEELQEKLYNLIDEYARTSLDEREESERFYFRSKIRSAGPGSFINYFEHSDSIELNDIDGSPFCQTQFTLKEIDEIKEKFGLTLSDFEQIPLNEDDKIKEDEE